MKLTLASCHVPEVPAAPIATRLLQLTPSTKQRPSWCQMEGSCSSLDEKSKTLGELNLNWVWRDWVGFSSRVISMLRDFLPEIVALSEYVGTCRNMMLLRFALSPIQERITICTISPRTKELSSFVIFFRQELATAPVLVSTISLASDRINLQI